MRELETVSNKILNMFNIPVDNSSNVIRIYKGSDSLYECNDVLAESYKANFDGHSDYNQPYEINCGTNSGIVIDKTEYSKKQEGINIVVYDNNYREVLDSVVLLKTEDGKIELKR